MGVAYKRFFSKLYFDCLGGGSFPHISDVRIMMFTTSRHKMDQDIAREQGASAFAVKPSTLEDVVEIVSMVHTLVPQQDYALAV